MYNFDYCRPTSVDEAARLLAEEDDHKLLAGGMSLIPALKMRLAGYSRLVDIGSLQELNGIRRDGDVLVIGAMTPHAVVAANAEVQSLLPALAILAEGIGDPLVRNCGTVGGSIANADPAADYPAGVVGLGATILTTKRKIFCDDFFTGLFATTLQPGEIITAVHFPIPEKAAYVKFRQPASRFALVGVFVAKMANGVRVAVTGAGPSVFRLKEAEAALARCFQFDALDGVEIKVDGLNSDIHGSADYRAHCVGVIAKRAILAAR